MKLVYITAKTFPSRKVDPFFHKSMAGAFAKLLGSNFTFVIRGSVPIELCDIPTQSLTLPKRWRSFFYFFKLPFFIFRNRLYTRDVFMYSYDPFLLSILIFWRKIFSFQYRICSEWHQLFHDWRDGFVARNSDAVITTSRRLRDLLIDSTLIDTERTFVAYGGVDVSLFQKKAQIPVSELRRKLSLPSKAFLVGYMGGFVSVGRDKGLDIMIKALSMIVDDVVMVFVGGTAQQIEKYRYLAETCGVERRCIFLEKRQFDTLVEYQMSMDVLVIPYPNRPHFNDYGFPLKVWEYMAAGHPIVYSDLAVIREVLGLRAIAFEPDNPRSLSDAIMKVYGDKEIARTLGMKNSVDVREFSWEKRAENIANFLDTGMRNDACTTAEKELRIYLNADRKAKLVNRAHKFFIWSR